MKCLVKDCINDANPPYRACSPAHGYYLNHLKDSLNEALDADKMRGQLKHYEELKQGSDINWLQPLVMEWQIEDAKYYHQVGVL